MVAPAAARTERRSGRGRWYSISKPRDTHPIGAGLSSRARCSTPAAGPARRSYRRTRRAIHNAPMDATRHPRVKICCIMIGGRGPAGRAGGRARDRPRLAHAQRTGRDRRRADRPDRGIHTARRRHLPAHEPPGAPPRSSPSTERRGPRRSSSSTGWRAAPTRELREGLPGIKLVQVIHVIGPDSVAEALAICPRGRCPAARLGTPRSPGEGAGRHRPAARLVAQPPDPRGFAEAGLPRRRAESGELPPRRSRKSARSASTSVRGCAPAGSSIRRSSAVHAGRGQGRGSLA